MYSIGGSVVECSPATRAARVRFPADAHLFASMFLLHFRVRDFFLKLTMNRYLSFSNFQGIIQMHVKHGLSMFPLIFRD